MPNVKDLTKAIVCAVLLAPAFGGCSSEKNHDERMLAAGPPKDPRCIDQCQPDPGSSVVNCSAEEAGLEFLRVWNFQNGTAEALYEYDDDTTQYREPVGYQPVVGFEQVDDFQRATELRLAGEIEQADALEAPVRRRFQRCNKYDNLDGDTANDNHALRIYGGPFLNWGGGVGRRLDAMVQNAVLVSPGGEEPLNCFVPPKPDHCPKDGSAYPNHSIDLSAWEGISFWARRGPDSQEGFRVLIGDSNTDDDIAFLDYHATPPRPLRCERNLECGCRSKPCSVWDPAAAGLANPMVPAGTYCFDPATDPIPEEVFGTTSEYQRCGSTRCDFMYEAFGMGDQQFNGKPCAEYAFDGGIVGDYCYDPVNGPEPAKAEASCGDHWMRAVHLTTEWKFYKIPFTDLGQQGWAKEFSQLNISEVTLLRFTWDRGWADFYVDDVSFYRRVE